MPPRITPMRIVKLTLLLAALLLAGPASAAPLPVPPPKEVPLVEKPLADLSVAVTSQDGQTALGIDPAKWRHAETPNFVVHYRRATEARKVVREVEYTLWYVAATLGAGPEQYARKSHIYVFEDEAEWQRFLELSQNPMKWAASYAHGDELFLNVRGAGNSGTGSFDSHTLAHEATHAVIARLYPQQRWPLWLNEGFAEYMGGASTAARKGQAGRRYQRALTLAAMPLETLGKLEDYPTDEMSRQALYQTSEKLVRFLMTELPRERILPFIQAIVGGADLPTAIQTVYAAEIKDWPSFLRRYERFSR